MRATYTHHISNTAHERRREKRGLPTQGNMVQEVQPPHDPVQRRSAPILVHRAEDGLHRRRDHAVRDVLASRFHEDAVAYPVDPPPFDEVATREHIRLDPGPVRYPPLVSPSSSTPNAH